MFPYNICENLWLSNPTKKSKKTKNKRSFFGYENFAIYDFDIEGKHDLLVQKHRINLPRLDKITELRRKKDFFSAVSLAITYFIILGLTAAVLLLPLLHWLVF
jgi:hypothetical protein